MAKTRAQKNREIRQEAIRQQLATYGLIQQVVEIADKLATPTEETTSTIVSSLKASADLKMKLVDKYLPSLQSVESVIETVNSDPSNLSDDQLADIATGSSTGTSKQETGEKIVH